MAVTRWLRLPVIGTSLITAPQWMRQRMVAAADELTSAAGTFNDSADEIVDDLKNMNEAAKNDNQEEFDAASTSLQNHGKENDEAATEIGADDCVG